jgi:hypothetical protein
MTNANMERGASVPAVLAQRVCTTHVPHTYLPRNADSEGMYDTYRTFDVSLLVGTHCNCPTEIHALRSIPVKSEDKLDKEGVQHYTCTTHLSTTQC